jgi:hypothetical protein
MQFSKNGTGQMLYGARRGVTKSKPSEWDLIINNYWLLDTQYLFLAINNIII